MNKNFDAWNKIKKGLDTRRKIPEFSEREIWWCSLGANVGYEVDGKNEHFERPICIVRKFNKDTFLGLPLTTQKKTGIYYFPYTLHKNEGGINLSQGKLLSSKRLTRRITKMDDEEFVELKKRYQKLFD